MPSRRPAIVSDLPRVITQHYEPAVPVESLQPHPMNANRGADDLLDESIEANGFYGSVLVQTATGYIIAGSQRWHAAKRKQLPTVPVIYADVTDAQARRIMAVDNRARDRARYDDRALVQLLQSIEEDGDDLLGTGFDTAELDALLASVANEPTEPPPSSRGLGSMWTPTPLGGGAGSGDDDVVDENDGRAGADGGGSGGGMLTGQTGNRGTTPEEYFARYQQTNLRQIVLILPSTEYHRVLECFQQIARREDLETNLDVVLYLLERDAAAHPGMAVSHRAD